MTFLTRALATLWAAWYLLAAVYMSTIHCLVNLLVRISIDQNQFQRLLSSSNPSIAILSQKKKKYCRWYGLLWSTVLMRVSIRAWQALWLRILSFLARKHFLFNPWQNLFDSYVGGRLVIVFWSMISVIMILGTTSAPFLVPISPPSSDVKFSFTGLRVVFGWLPSSLKFWESNAVKRNKMSWQ